MRLITTHRNADFDAFGAMAGIHLMDPSASFYFPGGMEASLRTFIATGLYPFKNIRTRRLKEIDIDGVTMVDTADGIALGNLAERILDESIPVTLIDHHGAEPGKPPFPGTKMTVRRRGATCTIITELLVEKKISIPPLEATLMMMGIHEDTGHLLFPETTREDLAAVNLLLDCQADLTLVRRFTMRDLTPHQLGLISTMADNTVTFTIRGHRVTLASLNLESYEEDLAFVVHKFVDLFQESIFIGLFNEGGKIYLIGRSRNENLNMGKVMERFGGGGHPSAAAAVIQGDALVETKEHILQILEDSLPPGLTAQSIMSPHVHGIEMARPVREGLARLNQLKVNAMPVFQGRHVVGSLTRQLIDNALHHELHDQPVSRVMQPKPAIVSPGTPIEEMAEEMNRSGVRFILVGEEDDIRGIVTRMDVYRNLLPLNPALKERMEGRMARLAKGRSRIIHLLERGVPPPLLALLKTAGETAEDLGMKCYLVGGMVRDLLLDLPNLDVDLVVEGDGIAFARRLIEDTGGTLSSHEKFLTAKVTLPDGMVVDVATARSEHYAAPAALPSVQAGVLRQDLYRRDFTINTLTVILNPSSFGRLLDFFGGYQDLKAGIIRVLHSLSFIEDPTRSLRAVQLSIRLNFTLSQDTRFLILTAADQGAFDALSSTRMWEELKTILDLPRLERALELMEDLHLLRVIHPQLHLDTAFAALWRRVREVIDWASVEKIPAPPRHLLALMLLLLPLDEEARREGVKRVGIGGKQALDLHTWPREGGRLSRDLLAASRPSDAVAIMDKTAEPLLFMTMAISEDARVRDLLRNYLKSWRGLKPRVRGKDLLEHGIPPGPHIGKALAQTRMALIDGRVKTREEEIAHACRLASDPSVSE